LNGGQSGLLEEERKRQMMMMMVVMAMVVKKTKKTMMGGSYATATPVRFCRGNAMGFIREAFSRILSMHIQDQCRLW
jgi:hypothetical protein